jgi:hypothetical protein
MERTGKENLLDIYACRPKIIKLNQETSLNSKASDWLKWFLVAISANQVLEI